MHALLVADSTRPLNIILEYLWFPEIANFKQISKKCYEMGTRPAVGHTMFYKLIGRAYRYTKPTESDVNSEIVNCHEDSWFLLARRIPSWPQCVDCASLKIVPRNIRVMSSQISPAQIGLNGTRISKRYNAQEGCARVSDCCVVYGGRKKESHKGSAVVMSDDHLPCLPGMFTLPRHESEGTLKPWERPPLVEMQKTKKEGVVTRIMAPFTRCLCDPSTRQMLSYLSCISYFEVEILHNLGYSAMDDFRRFSMGIACSLFPLRKKQLGFDQHSFGYHRDGSLVHGCRKLAQMAAYSTGDTIGCGLIYPPLTNSPLGKIFFTKNGGLVGIFDMGVESLFSLPWFPALGLAPSIPMEFKFGLYEPYLFDILDFERNFIGEVFPGSGFEFYQSLVAEQEMNFKPNIYVRHPLYMDHYITEYHTLYGNANGTNGGLQPASSFSALSTGGKRRSNRYRGSSPSIGNSNGSVNSAHSAESDGAGAGAGAGAGTAQNLPSSTNGGAYDSLLSPNAVLNNVVEGPIKPHMKRLPNLHHSMYLDNEIRAATWLAINDTKRVTFQGSDASWEDSAEGDESDEDEESESDSNVNRNKNNSRGRDEDDTRSEVGSDHMQVDPARIARKRNISREGQFQRQGGRGGQEPLVGVLRHGVSTSTTFEMQQQQQHHIYYPGGTAHAQQYDDSNRMETSEVIHNDPCFGSREHTGLRRGSGDIARKAQTNLRSPHGHLMSVRCNKGRLDYLADGSGSVTSEGTEAYNENFTFLEGHSSQSGHKSSAGHTVISSYVSSGSGNASEVSGPHSSSRKSRGYTELRNHEQILALEASYGLESSSARVGHGEDRRKNRARLDSSSLGGPGGGYYGEDESNDSDSIATSMFVEVASVDEDGSYIGYGGSTPPMSEIDEDFDHKRHNGQASDAGGSGYKCSRPTRALRSPGGWASGESSHDDWSTAGGTLGSLQSFGQSSGQSKHFGFYNDQGGVHRYVDTFSSHDASHSQDPPLGLAMSTRTLPEDGYDGASEKGRNDEDVDIVDDDASHSEAFATGAEPFLEKEKLELEKLAEDQTGMPPLQLCNEDSRTFEERKGSSRKESPGAIIAAAADALAHVVQQQKSHHYSSGGSLSANHSESATGGNSIDGHSRPQSSGSSVASTPGANSICAHGSSVGYQPSSGSGYSQHSHRDGPEATGRDDSLSCSGSAPVPADLVTDTYPRGLLGKSAYRGNARSGRSAKRRKTKE